MNKQTISIASTNPARLMIHSAGEFGGDHRSYRRWPHTWIKGDRVDRERGPLRLQVADAQGVQVFAIDDAGPLVEVALQAGTYRVSARAGNLLRSYTMTLEGGGLLHLYLQLAF